ncbi:MAG: prephenate dehydratase [Chloroflexi bacterium]|nr:prephenate dehydratase [Chloroflexota bacterium]
MAQRLAYLGPPGTFSEQAAIKFSPGAQHVPFPTITAVASAVMTGMAEEGIVPIENSLEGSVPETLDLLISEGTLHIRQEVMLPIEHCLLARPDTTPQEVQVIFSHPQALGQCRRFLERCFPKAQLVASLSTVAAVQEMKGASAPSAAIAPGRAAELYGTAVLARGVQDHPNNVTRFVVLATNDHPRTGQDRTSLCFSFADDRPGLLYGVIGEFSRRGINLAKVESRPTKESLGRYIFLIDIDGHREDPLVKEALEAVGKQASVLRVFGSYPRSKA